MSKTIKAVDAAQAVSEQFGIPLADLVDVFAEIPSQETELVKRTIGSRDPKMTEAEIMNALEDKAKSVCGVCDGKLGNTISCDNCIFYAIKFALDLINRKNAEIEDLQAENKDIVIIRGEGGKIVEKGHIVYLTVEQIEQIARAEAIK